MFFRLTPEQLQIGFSIFHTFDEVDSTILANMRYAAVESGVTLLVHDADCKQDVQNLAVEQWILGRVDGIIFAPCDFIGVNIALDMPGSASIPVVTLNVPLAECINATVLSDTVEQDTISGKLLKQALLARGKPMKVEIVYQTLPFMSPNAAIWAKGYADVFETLKNTQA
jgi:ABC-type sugar transport system substrate-binding protein